MAQDELNAARTNLLSRLTEASASKNLESETSAVPEVNLSKLVETWIELQDAVNSFMDSSKDPNPVAKDVPMGNLPQIPPCHALSGPFSGRHKAVA